MYLLGCLFISFIYWGIIKILGGHFSWIAYILMYRFGGLNFAYHLITLYLQLKTWL